MRGPFPGLGSALKAFGIPQGNLIAFELASAQEQSEDQWTEDPWDLVEQILGNPKSAPGDLYRFVGGTYWDLWQSLSGERRTLLKLLSRFELSEDQAVRYYEPAERQRSGIAASDKEIIENPFLLYELDRDDPDPISIKTIDQGAFPDDVITQRFPIAGDSGWSSIHPHESPSPHGCKHAPMSQEILAITIVLKNGISTVPTTHHVVNGTIVLYSRHSWHNQEHTHSKLKAPCCGVVSFTPFSQYLSSFHVA